MMSELSSIVSELNLIITSATSTVSPDSPSQYPKPAALTQMDPEILRLRCQLALAKSQAIMGQIKELANSAHALTAELQQHSIKCREAQQLSRTAVHHFHAAVGPEVLGDLTLPDSDSGYSDGL
jgi:hypothetical protein